MISAYGLQHTQTPTWAYPARGGRNTSESSNILLTCYRLKTVFVATCTVTIGYSDNSFTFELSAK